jgi:hypothetical protein
VLVAGLVDASVFLAQVELPVGGEVAVGPQGAQFEDGFGAVQAPPGAGDVEPVADQVPAGPSITPVAIGQPRARAVW